MILDLITHMLYDLSLLLFISFYSLVLGPCSETKSLRTKAGDKLQ